jgi:hypothetical protein
MEATLATSVRQNHASLPKPHDRHETDPGSLVSTRASGQFRWQYLGRGGHGGKRPSLWSGWGQPRIDGLSQGSFRGIAGKWHPRSVGSASRSVHNERDHPRRGRRARPKKRHALPGRPVFPGATNCGGRRRRRVPTCCGEFGGMRAWRWTGASLTAPTSVVFIAPPRIVATIATLFGLCDRRSSARGGGSRADLSPHHHDPRPQARTGVG